MAFGVKKPVLNKQTTIEVLDIKNEYERMTSTRRRSFIVSHSNIMNKPLPGNALPIEFYNSIKHLAQLDRNKLDAASIPVDSAKERYIKQSNMNKSASNIVFRPKVSRNKGSYDNISGVEIQIKDPKSHDLATRRFTGSSKKYSVKSKAKGTERYSREVSDEIRTKARSIKFNKSASNGRIEQRRIESNLDDLKGYIHDQRLKKIVKRPVISLIEQFTKPERISISKDKARNSPSKFSNFSGKDSPRKNYDANIDSPKKNQGSSFKFKNLSNPASKITEFNLGELSTQGIEVERRKEDPLKFIKRAEKGLSVHQILDEKIKAEEVISISELLDQVNVKLKVTFGLFTQEKSKQLFEQIQKLMEVVLDRSRPQDLVNGVSLVCIKVLLGYSEYYKCIWCLKSLININEREVLRNEKRKKELKNFLMLRKSLKDSLIHKSHFSKDSNLKDQEVKDQNKLVNEPFKKNPLLKILQYLYKQCGQCYRYTHQPTEAIKNFYKYLFISIFLSDDSQETNSYELLGRSYFELGDAGRAKYFNERVIQNIKESRESITRKLYPDLRYRYNLSKMDINDSSSNLRNDSPDLTHYEGIPLSHQNILNDLLDSTGKQASQEYLTAKRQGLQHSTKDMRILKNSIDARAKKTKLGEVKIYGKGYGSKLQPGYGMFIASRLKLKNNSLDQILMTHKSPNRSILVHSEVPELRGKEGLKNEFLEVFFKEEAIEETIEEFNSCGLLIQKLKKYVDVLQNGNDGDKKKISPFDFSGN